MKGVGLVGAIVATEQAGHSFHRVAGTSAGSIVAAMLAAGMDGLTIKGHMDRMTFTTFLDTDSIDRLPVVGKALSFLAERGVYEGTAFERWMSELLRKPDGTALTFGDLETESGPRLQVIATDITNHCMAVLPRDLPAYGYDPATFPVSLAVRMSMSIPVFFEPVRLGSTYFVDGGCVSNYPVWLFDSDPEPTVGYKLVDPGENEPCRIADGVDLAKAVVATMLENYDKIYIKDSQFVNTVPIPASGVKTTDFKASKEVLDRLYLAGSSAAHGFFDTWTPIKAPVGQKSRKMRLLEASNL